MAVILTVVKPNSNLLPGSLSYVIATGRFELSIAVASKLTTGSNYSIFYGHVSVGAAISA